MALMKAPSSGVTIRMYRQGHGDCFLLAFPRKGGGRRPVYMLIDCGYKPGSQITRKNKKVDATRVIKDIATATGENIDIVVITHEHQDHVNAFGKFKNFEIGEAWFAWTEDPDDDDANTLRQRHKDQLLGLLGARNALQLAVANPDAQDYVARIDELLALEFGNDVFAATQDDTAIINEINHGAVFGVATDPLKSQNKKAMALIKERADHLQFIRPHQDVLTPGDAEHVRVFPLGPPKDEDLLQDEDPVGDDGFPGHASAVSLSFFAAASANVQTGHQTGMPFNSTFCIEKDTALLPGDFGDFFKTHYGNSPPADPERGKEAADDASWRRINEEWLFAAESFALKLNRGINNTTLVLAIELVQSGKVLLFTGDAQLGNWKSWDDGDFQIDGKTITAKDLLKRTVVYKVGHHGSHNATLAGKLADDYPNLGWMAHGKYASEFTCFITAHNKWALDTAKWNHPLPSIKKELMKKAAGRVFQTDEDSPTKPDNVSQSEWGEFMREDRVKCTDLYFELTVLDE
jgi:beta-lactamase superfamily II metal-dependent hydrolase